jgi:hypothetical protein
MRDIVALWVVRAALALLWLLRLLFDYRTMFGIVTAALTYVFAAMVCEGPVVPIVLIGIALLYSVLAFTLSVLVRSPQKPSASQRPSKSA